MDPVPTPAINADAYRGERIGRFEVLTQLQIGGMAELLLAFTSGPGRFRKYVVIKRILPDIQQSDEFVQMFLDEARISASFNHPNICQVFDLGEDESALYLAMEFIAGQNLNQLSNACVKAKRVVPVGLVAMIGRDLCRALHYAHTFTGPTGEPSPVIHRDVAEKNVMVTYDGAVKLLDFGVAKARGSLGRTEQGMVKGTTGYMSPEQVQDAPLDGRSDVFSVGVVLHELLTGQRLFADETEQGEMEKILHAEIAWPSQVAPHVPEVISEVVMKALSREPADRFTTALEMARALEKAAGNLMFDADSTSQLMRELFEDKLTATRAMLAGADSREQSYQFLSALRDVKRDDGSTFVERPPEPLSNATTRPKIKSLSREMPAVTLGNVAEPASLVDPQDSVRNTHLVLWAVGFLFFGLGILIAAETWLFPPKPESDEDRLILAEAQRLQVEDGLRDEAGGTPDALDAATPAGSELERRRSKRAIRRGTLSLVTDKPAIVRLGRRVLGKTPLINVAIPAGNQLLVIEAGGKRRRVFVPIEAGKNTPLNLALETLPVE